eukprot:Transcript_16881.p1 GENE.Transcript_16881~~Transcript_16881.p1  ORF type:complete len:445 (-),score=125.59 Transcript_16881:336-1619(-)
MLQLFVFTLLLLGADALAARCRTSQIQMSAVTRNANMGKLQAGYLFPEIGKRRTAFLEKNPDANIISLGIGDTTLPVPDHILNGLQTGVSNLGAKETYTGYGAEQGVGALRAKISEKLYGGRISPDEVFVSDGSKCDIGRLQMMFGNSVVSAVQDPSYPVYVDTSVMMGQTGEMNMDLKQYGGIVYMPCNPENDFFPDLDNTPKADVVYFCSPNNPTGAAATRPQLEELVKWALDRGSIIVFDAAYAPFIRSPDVPKSIYEIEGAELCAIEVNSLSKYAGFTGVRLGWTIVPKGLKFADGFPVANDYNRVMCTAFNGASNIVQACDLPRFSHASPTLLLCISRASPELRACRRARLRPSTTRASRRSCAALRNTLNPGPAEPAPPLGIACGAASHGGAGEADRLLHGERGDAARHDARDRAQGAWWH